MRLRNGHSRHRREFAGFVRLLDSAIKIMNLISA